MKTINSYLLSIVLLTVLSITSAQAQDVFPSAENLDNANELFAAEKLLASAVILKDATNTTSAVAKKNLSNLNFAITIPAEWQSQIVRQDYENQSVFSLKTTTESPAFLFSITKVTGQQWMKVKNQIDSYTIIENKDGFITFVQRTEVREMTGRDSEIYQRVLNEMEEMIKSIVLQ